MDGTWKYVTRCNCTTPFLRVNWAVWSAINIWFGAAYDIWGKITQAKNTYLCVLLSTLQPIRRRGYFNLEFVFWDTSIYRLCSKFCTTYRSYYRCFSSLPIGTKIFQWPSQSSLLARREAVQGELLRSRGWNMVEEVASASTTFLQRPSIKKLCGP